MSNARSIEVCVTELGKVQWGGEEWDRVERVEVAYEDQGERGYYLKLYHQQQKVQDGVLSVLLGGWIGTRRLLLKAARFNRRNLVALSVNIDQGVVEEMREVVRAKQKSA